MSGKTVRFCGIAYIKEENGEPFVLLLPPFGRRTQAKIPGGMEEDTDGTPSSAVSRESLEELGITPLNAERVVSCEDPNNPLSLRDFWGATKWKGDIRTEVKQDNGDTLPPPVWTKIDHSLLSREMVVYSHREALKKVIAWGVNKLPAFYYLAQNEGLI
ncbi:MAG: NUDIX domain-containing protein [Candidatus Campbellbacteria bacterium]|nr:NUDIX domain-containing protein [Candidatus Campbellbacteria bacterium]